MSRPWNYRIECFECGVNLGYCNDHTPAKNADGEAICEDCAALHTIESTVIINVKTKETT